jgi:PEP-CTERM motif
MKFALMSVSMKNRRNSKATVFVFAILAVAFASLNSLHAGVILNLADIVGGGNGTGNGTANQGINILTGNIVAPGSVGGITAVPNAFVLSANPFVDGVFVPDGGPTGSASIQVSSTGLMVTGISDSSQVTTWDHFRNGNNFGVSNSFLGSSVIGAHASKGITFDLNAMEAFHSGQASSYNITAGTGNASGASVDFYLFVDGIFKNFVFLTGSGKSSNFSGTFSSSDRFLTLITSPRGNFGSDHSLWVNPTVTLSSVVAVPNPSSAVVPEPSSAVILLIGAATFALRFRRKK